MMFKTRDPNSTSEWMPFFAWLPVRAGRADGKFIWIWLETANYRWVPIGQSWAREAWECSPVLPPKGFVSEVQFIGVFT